MARRYELTAKQFVLIEDLLPAQGKRGGRWNDHHTTLNGIFWWLYSGAQWREVPERHGKWQSIYDRFNFWRADGMFDRILERLHLRLNEERRLDHALCSRHCPIRITAPSCAPLQATCWGPAVHGPRRGAAAGAAAPARPLPGRPSRASWVRPCAARPAWSSFARLPATPCPPSATRCSTWARRSAARR